MKPDKGRAMPVSLVRLHAFKPKPTNFIEFQY